MRNAAVSKVAGNCYLIRGQEVSVRISKGQDLRAGDLLELGEKCVLRIEALGHAPINLTQKNGRFMKLIPVRASE